MRKAQYIFITLLILCKITFAQTQQSDTVVPASVRATFASIYPNATNVHWRRTNSFSTEHLNYVYRVKFRQGDYIISAATDSTGSRFAEFLHETYLPEGLWVKFMSFLPGAKITDCSTGNFGRIVMPHSGHYSVLFTYSSDTANYDGCVIFDSLFNVLEVWKDVPHNKLPNNITKFIKEYFKHCTYSKEEGSMIVEENGHITYFVSMDMPQGLGSYWLFFNEKGEVIKKEVHRWKTVGL